VRTRTAPALAARDPIERVFDFAGGKNLADFDLLAALPPIRADRIEYVLAGRLGRRFFGFVSLRLAV
jgi:hypothetical protein